MGQVVLREINKFYDGVHAVKDVNLQIRDKEFVVFVGPSGCGKTTTLRMIAGLETISSGDISIDGSVVNQLAPMDRDIAMVFQNYALYPHKTAYENIAFGLRMRGVAPAEVERRVQDAAKKLDITSLLGRRPSQLSGGQRQRVALGRAMVRQPAVFLMDEPLSNLDVALRISMRAEIKHLHQEMRTTFVYVTHDQAEALTLADRIVVMKEGQIQQIGTPNEVYDRPSNMFVASFLGNPPINYLEGAIEDEAGTPVFRYGSLRISLPAGKLRGVTAAPVLLGIRPEDVLRDSASGWPVFTGLVDSVLPVGSDRFLGLKVEGCDVFVRVDKETHHVQGQRVSFGLRPERLHLFDKASGASLIGGAA